MYMYVHYYSPSHISTGKIRKWLIWFNYITSYFDVNGFTVGRGLNFWSQDYDLARATPLVSWVRDGSGTSKEGVGEGTAYGSVEVDVYIQTAVSIISERT